MEYEKHLESWNKIMSPLAYKYSRIQFILCLLFMVLWLLPFSEYTKNVMLVLFLTCLMLVAIGIIIAWYKYYKYSFDHELVFALNGFSCSKGCDVLLTDINEKCPNCHEKLVESRSIRYKWEAKEENLQYRKLNKKEKDKYSFLENNNARPQT